MNFKCANQRIVYICARPGNATQIQDLEHLESPRSLPPCSFQAAPPPPQNRHPPDVYTHRFIFLTV